MREGSVATRSYRRADPALVQKMRPKPFRPEAGKIPFDTQAVLDRYTTDHKANYHEDNSIKTTLNL